MSVYAGDQLAQLEASLESLCSQTHKADIFIQQDGRLLPEVGAYLDQEFDAGRIVYLGKREENRGLAFSLNELLRLVLPNYHYIVRMDADDISVPDRIAQQYDFMQKHPQVDVTGGAIEEFSDDGSYHKVVRYPQTHEAMYRFFAKRVPLAHVTAFFRKSFFERAGLYPVESPTNEDTLLWMKGFEGGCRFANIPELVVRVRVSSDFFSRRGGWRKAWSDFKDRVKVIQTLGYNFYSYIYAAGLLLVNISPGFIKRIMYQRLR